MSHEIETHADGSAAFISARIPAWHRLGTVVEADGLTVPEALKGGLLGGWEVELMPLITSTHDGSPMPVPGRYATVRKNPVVEGQSDILGVGLTDDYEVIQNEQVAEWMQTVADEGGANVQTAGALFDGRQVFFTMKMPEGLMVGGQDATDVYLTCMSSHDASLALTTIVTPVRVVCNNTLTLALKGATVAHKVKHLVSKQAQAAEARDALGLTFGYADRWNEAMESLLAEKMTDNAFDKLVAENFLKLDEDAQVAPATRTRILNGRDELHALFTAAPTQEFGRGTKYAAFNALTEWAEWIRPSDTDRSASSVLFGTSRDLRQRAYAILAK